jgi:hypothetical protein
MRRTALLGIALLLLQGCGGMTTMFKGPDQTPACPRVAVLADAARQVKFRPGTGRDLTDVEYEAQVLGVDGTCAYDRKKSQVEIDFLLDIEVARGPGNADRRADVEFFVAVLDPDQNVLGKETFVSNVRFDANLNRVIVSENIAPTLPLHDIARGPGYTVFIGLQLDAEELEYMRTRVTSPAPVVRSTPAPAQPIGPTRQTRGR